MAEGAPIVDPRPVPPVRPAAGDCCQGGCDPCVFELYEEELVRYEQALREWLQRQTARSP